MKALASALAVLRCFDPDEPEWGLTELSVRTGLEKSHVHKILREMVASGFIAQDPSTRRYHVGPQGLSLGAGYLGGSDLLRRGAHHLPALAQTTGFTATLNEVTPGGVFFCAVDFGRAGRPSLPLGTRLPLHATAAGKLHMAYGQRRSTGTPGRARTEELRRELEMVKAQGFACTRGQSTPGMGALSVPVIDDEHGFIAAVSVIYPLNSTLKVNQRDLVQAARETAARILHR
jgi:DNA-binding IclR family transcriptional regulator